MIKICHIWVFLIEKYSHRHGNPSSLLSHQCHFGAVRQQAAVKVSFPASLEDGCAVSGFHALLADLLTAQSSLCYQGHLANVKTVTADDCKHVENMAENHSFSWSDRRPSACRTPSFVRQKLSVLLHSQTFVLNWKYADCMTRIIEDCGCVYSTEWCRQ